MQKIDDAVKRFADEIRRHWQEMPMPIDIVDLARALCRAEGRDPDEVVFGGGDMVPEIVGRTKAMKLTPYMFHPSWAEYYAMAEGAIEERDAKNRR